MPFARERETRQTDRCTASDVRTAYQSYLYSCQDPGLVSLPPPLDLAGQGRSCHIRSQPSSPSAEDRGAPALRLAARAYRSSTLSTFLRMSFLTRRLLGCSATTCLPSWFLLHQRSGSDCMPGASSTASGPMARVLLTSCPPPTPKFCSSPLQIICQKFATGCDSPTSDLVIKCRALHLSPTPGRVTLQSKHPVPSLARTMSDASMLYRDLMV